MDPPKLLAPLVLEDSLHFSWPLSQKSLLTPMETLLKNLKKVETESEAFFIKLIE